MRLKTLATHPVWREPRTVFGVWMLTGVIFAIVKLLIGKYNNYKIFEGVYWHAIEGLTLYGDHYPEYYDSNHYGILFSLIIAPFALLPEWLGIILWDKIILKKYNPADIFTGEDMDDLIDYKGKKVSRKSIIELAKLAGFEITEA